MTEVLGMVERIDGLDVSMNKTHSLEGLTERVVKSRRL